MAQSNYSKEELPSISLYQDHLSKRYQLQISYASNAAELEKKIKLECMTQIYQEEVELAEKALVRKRDSIRKEHEDELKAVTWVLQDAIITKNKLAEEEARKELARINNLIQQETLLERQRLDAAIEDRLRSEESVKQRLNKINEERFNQQYKVANIYDKKQLADRRKNALLELKLNLDNNLKLQEEDLARLDEEIQKQQTIRAESEEGSDEAMIAAAELTSLSQKREEILQNISSTESEIEETKKAESEWAKESAENNIRVRAAEEAKLSATERYTKAKERQKTLEEEIDKLNREIAVNEELGIDTTALKETLADFTIEFDEIGSKIGDHAKAAAKEQKKKAKSNVSTEFAELKDAILHGKNASQEAQENIQSKKDEAAQKTAEQFQALAKQSLDAIDSNIKSFFEYQASINARLQGADKTYTDMVRMVRNNVGISGVTNQKEVLANIKKLVESGVAYDIEARAYLATMTEEIAQTFDAFDGNLLRMIRLQQADITASRLGMEAALLTFFNENFKDSSYLSDGFDQVTSAIFDASAQLSKEESMAFEYMTQKWMGALYSLGFSQETTSKIAEGLNYLGTGNVDALNGNESLQTLMAMSAARSGISYADILTQGLNADTTNKLLKSMVEYLYEIATNTDNQVTKSAYSTLLGLNISDLKTVSTLSQEDIDGIYNSTLNYSQAMSETANQLSQVASRTHLSQILDTAFENALATSSTLIGNNVASYATWKVLNVVEDLTGGIAIPSVLAAGFGVDLETTVTQAAKTGMAGLGLMGSLLSSLFSGSLFGTSDLNKWGYSEYNSRGDQIKGISKGVSSGRSVSSEMVGSASSSDVKNSTLSESASSAEEDSKITNKSTADQADAAQKFNEHVLEALGYPDSPLIEQVVAIHGQTLELNSAMIKAHELHEGAYNNIRNLLSLDRYFKTHGGIATFQSDLLEQINSIDISTQELSAVLTYSAATEALLTAHNFSSTLSATAQTSLTDLMEYSTSMLSQTSTLTGYLKTANVANMSAIRTIIAESEIEDAIAESRAAAIQELGAVNELLKSEVAAKEAGEAVLQKVKIEDISQALRDSLKTELRTLIASAMADALVNKIAGSDDDTDTVLSRLRSAIEDITVKINDDSVDSIGSAIGRALPGSII